MPYNGSGTFSVYTPGTPYVTGTTISSTVANNVNSDFATGLTTALTKNGQTTPTANLPMGLFKLTGLGAGSLPGDSVRYEQLQNISQNWIAAGGTADAITATYAPAISALVDGQLCYFRASAANATTTPTFSPNGLTARTIVLEGGSALRVNEIPAANAEVILRYNLANTRWELLNPAFARTGANADITSLQSSTTVTTQAAGDNSTKIASTAYTDRAARYSEIASGRNMKCSVANVSANQATFTADEVKLKDTSGNLYLASTVSVTPDLSASGANGLDTGAEASSTWYYLWVIYNGTTVAGLWSLSATAPTMPGGYTYKALVSCGYNNGSSNLLSAFQAGNEYLYRGAQNVLAAGTSTVEAAITITAAVPPICTAFALYVRILGATGSGAGVLDPSINIRVVSGVAFTTAAISLQAVGISVAQSLPGPTLTVPYTGNLYYLLAVTNSTSPTTTIDVTSFKLPMGGE